MMAHNQILLQLNEQQFSDIRLPYGLRRQQIALAIFITEVLREISKVWQTIYQLQALRQRMELERLDVEAQQPSSRPTEPAPVVQSNETLKLQQRRDELLKQLDELSKQINRAIGRFDTLSNRLEFLKTEHQEIVKYVDLQQRQIDAMKPDVEQGLDRLIPSMKPAKKKQLMNNFEKHMQQQATLVEAEARYVDSLQQVNENPEDIAFRDHLSIALHNSMIQELQMRFWLQQVLRDVGIEKSALQIRGLANDFFKTYLTRDEVLKRAELTAATYSSEDTQKVIGILKKERTLAAQQAIKEEVRELRKEIPLCEKMLKDLMRDFAATEKTLEGVNAQISVLDAQMEYSRRPSPFGPRQPRMAPRSDDSQRGG